MDVNATLAQLRQAMIDMDSAGDGQEFEHAASQVPELFEALDGWITRGGFLPDDWRKPLRLPLKLEH